MDELKDALSNLISSLSLEEKNNLIKTIESEGTPKTKKQATADYQIVTHKYICGICSNTKKVDHKVLTHTTFFRNKKREVLFEDHICDNCKKLVITGMAFSMLMIKFSRQKARTQSINYSIQATTVNTEAAVYYMKSLYTPSVKLLSYDTSKI